MKRKLLLALGCLVGLATLSYGGHVWYTAITFVSTDDAYVEGTISPVSAKVAGHIVELLVQDNQAVKQGDVLLRVDPRDFQAKREQARAEFNAVLKLDPKNKFAKDKLKQIDEEIKDEPPSLTD